jgi:hypothetical protein
MKEEPIDLKIFVRRTAPHERDIDDPGLDGPKLLHRVQCLDVDTDVGLPFAEATQDMWDRHVAGPGGTGDRKSITLASERPTGGEHRAVNLHEHLAHVLQKEPPGARQPHPPFAAIEQPDLDLFLQLFDLLTERRLRDVEALGGATEV